jgi:hypothetical protein
MSTDQLHLPPSESTLQLRAELVEVRKALELTPTFAPGVDGRPALSQYLLTLLDREAQLMGTLRQEAAGWGRRGMGEGQLRSVTPPAWHGNS